MRCATLASCTHIGPERHWDSPLVISNAFQRARSPDLPGPKPAGMPVRLLLVVVFFAVAFTIDVLSGRQYSQLLGGAAIFGSILTLFPAIRPSVIAASVYALTWTAFNVVRAFADDARLAIGDPSSVSDFEGSLFGGTLPTMVLQRRAFDPEQIQPHDIALALVHASFFVVPFLIAAIAWRRHRPLFNRYLLATAICFALSLVAFFALPTAPPWMSDPGDVTRITHHILRGSGETTADVAVSSAAFWFEPNDLAALPSVHVAMAVLVFLVVGGMARRWGRLVGACYALTMSVSVVYLGEHFLLDVISGWFVALVAWSLSRPKRW